MSFRCDLAGIVKEGLAMEALPWEAKALDGLELPITSSVGRVFGIGKGRGL